MLTLAPPAVWRPAVTAASSISLASTWSGMAGLGRQEHDEPRVGEVGQGVDERVDEVVVALPEPDEDRVGDVGIVLVLELGPR